MGDLLRDATPAACMATGERRRLLAGEQLGLGEEEGGLLLGVLRRVAAVDRVALDRGGEQLADGALVRLRGVCSRSVSPGFFEALGLRAVEGRLLDASDPGRSPSPVVVNRRFAERYFPKGDPIGSRVSFDFQRADWSTPAAEDLVIVGERRRELGLRQALGATPGDLVRRVLLDGLRPVAWGLAAGLAIAAAASRLAANQLYGVSVRDPLAFLAALAVMALVGALACLPPALRAAGGDPARSLHEG